VTPLGSTSKTRLEETARPMWILGADGEVMGIVANPLHVSGTVALAADEEGDGFERDETTGALTIITVPHHEIHEGETHLCSYKTPDGAPLADNATIAFVVTVGAKECHMTAAGAVGGDFEGELREDVTYTGGTAVAIFNKKRSSSEGATATVVRDPTITDAGTLLENRFVPGGTGPQAVGGVGGQRAEWILEPGRVYLYRITNRAGNNQPGSLVLEWYEETV
jgi:hypothetical protein